MSYGPPPKTPYGDQDFIKEDWPAAGGAPTSGSPPQGPPRRPTSPYGGQSYPPPLYAQAPAAPLQQAPYGQQPLAPNPVGQIDPKQLVAAATYNLTPEDQIFMQSWRKDSFYQRVLPLTIIGNGGYFYYNYSRQLPQRVIPYLLITSSAYIIGKWSYKNELKRRVEANPSQTPFMMSLRTLVGAQNPMAGIGGEFTSDMGGQDFMGGGGFGSANAPPLAPPLAPTAVNSAYTRRGGPPPMGAQPASYSQGMLDNSQAYQHGSDTLGGSGTALSADGMPLSTTSYEELRARNRGLIQK